MACVRRRCIKVYADKPVEILPVSQRNGGSKVLILRICLVYGHSFLLGEIEEHAPVIVQPAVAGRQPHAVKQQAVQHLCFQ